MMYSAYKLNKQGYSWLKFKKNLRNFIATHIGNQGNKLKVLLLLFCPVDPLLPHGLQQARLPCPSLSPKICSNSCLLSHWCHPTISSSASACSPCLQSVPASGPFPMKWLFTSDDQNTGASGSVSDGKLRPRELKRPGTILQEVETQGLELEIWCLICFPSTPTAELPGWVAQTDVAQIQGSDHCWRCLFAQCRMLFKTWSWETSPGEPLWAGAQRRAFRELTVWDPVSPGEDRPALPGGSALCCSASPPFAVL